MEERRFDELTRALGQGVSRRTVLKGLLGAAFGGALAAVGVRVPRAVDAAAPTCNGIPYTPGLQCCEPAGIQPLYPIADLDLCPDRVPHPGHVPEFNGCGPAKGFSHFIIPNRIGPRRNIDFTQACNNHDICYDTCNSAKSGCDDAFLLDMSTACAAAYPGRGMYDRYMRNACVAEASLYFYAVSQTDAGTDAYESAQKLACDCCSVCQECGGSSDDRCCGGTCHDACPEGKERDPQTCECKCSSSCPQGQHQDPETCACEDLCEGVTCAECHICDPNSGNCVPGNDQASCGTDQVCCGGICQDECICPAPRILCNGICCEQNEICVDGTCQPPTGCAGGCGPDEICCNEIGILDNEGHTETWVCKKTSEYKICPVSPLSSSPGTRDDYICCPIDLECCGGTGAIYEICGGPSNGLCCPAGTSACGASSDESLFCCDFDWDHGSCRYNDETQSFYCDPS